MSRIQHFLFNSCWAVLRVWSNSNTVGHPVVRPYLSRLLCRKYNRFARLPLVNSTFCWIVGPCGVLFGVAFHGHTSSGIANPKRYRLQGASLRKRVFIAPVSVNKRNSPVRSSLPKMTPRIHLTLNLAPSPKHTSPNGTTSPV